MCSNFFQHLSLQMSLLCADIQDHFKSQILSQSPLLSEPNSPEQESNYNQNQSLSNIYKHGSCCRSAVDRCQRFSPTLLITLCSSRTFRVKNENSHTAHIYSFTGQKGHENLLTLLLQVQPNRSLTSNTIYSYLTDRQQSRKSEAAQTASSSSSSSSSSSHTV